MQFRGDHATTYMRSAFCIVDDLCAIATVVWNGAIQPLSKRKTREQEQVTYSSLRSLIQGLLYNLLGVRVESRRRLQQEH
jgi:hypothetical protein